MSGCPFHNQLKKDLPEPIPDRIKRSCAVDKRGYPIPFFVTMDKGEPVFQVIDAAKCIRCLKEKLCSICGERLKKHVAFVIGPLCTISGLSGEPPLHLECAEWSVKACPYINNPKYVRPDSEKLDALAPQVAVPENTGVMAIWVTKEYGALMREHELYVKMGKPTALTWWRKGRPATEAEVIEALRISRERAGLR